MFLHIFYHRFFAGIQTDCLHSQLYGHSETHNGAACKLQALNTDRRQVSAAPGSGRKRPEQKHKVQVRRRRIYSGPDVQAAGRTDNDIREAPFKENIIFKMCYNCSHLYFKGRGK